MVHAQRGVHHQRLVDQHVVQRLRVALERIRVALRRIGDQLRPIHQRHGQRAGHPGQHLVLRRGVAPDDAHHVHVAVVELERIEVADQHDLLVRVRLLHLLDQLRQVDGLRTALHPHALAAGGPAAAARQGVVDVVERTQVVDDHRQRIARGRVLVHAGAQAQRRTVVEQAGGAVRVGKGGLLAELRHVQHLDAGHTVGGQARADQEADVDAAHVVARLQVRHIARARGAGGVDAFGQQLQHAQVLHFHRAQDVRGLQVVADRQCRLGQPLVQRFRRQRHRAVAVVDLVEQAQQVEAADGDFVVVGVVDGFRQTATADGRRRGHVGQQRPGAGEVVQHAQQARDLRPGVDRQRLCADLAAAAHHQAFLVGVEARRVLAGRQGDGIHHADAGFAERTRHAGQGDVEHAVAEGQRVVLVDAAAGRGDHHRLRHAHAHAFQPLQRAGQGVGAEFGGGQFDRGGQGEAGFQHLHRRRDDLGDRQLMRIGRRGVFLDRAGHAHAVADRGGGGRCAAGEHEHGIGRGRVAVVVGGLQEEAVVELDRSDDALGHHALAVVRRQQAVALDLGDGQRQRRIGRFRRLCAAVARVRCTDREVGAVVVGVDAAVAATQRGGGVAQRAGRRAAFEAVGRAAETDEVDHVRIGGRAGTGQRRRAAAQRDLAGRAGHGDGAGGVGRGQVHRAAGALRLLDQVETAGRDAAAEVGAAIPGGTRGGGVLHAPAGQVDRGGSVVAQLDEVVLQRGAAVAAAAVDLADDHLRLHRRRGEEQGERREHGRKAAPWHFHVTGSPSVDWMPPPVGGGSAPGRRNVAQACGTRIAWA